VSDKDIWAFEVRNCRKLYRDPEETCRLRRLRIKCAVNIKTYLK